MWAALWHVRDRGIEHTDWKEKRQKMKATVFNVKHPSLTAGQADLPAPALRPLQPDTEPSEDPTTLSPYRQAPLQSPGTHSPISRHTHLGHGSEPASRGPELCCACLLSAPKTRTPPQYTYNRCHQETDGSDPGLAGVTPEGGRSCVCQLWAYHLLGPQLSAVGIVQSKQKNAKLKVNIFEGIKNADKT